MINEKIERVLRVKNNLLQDISAMKEELLFINTENELIDYVQNIYDYIEELLATLRRIQENEN